MSPINTILASLKLKIMENSKNCLVCKRSSDETPVTNFHYQEKTFYICTQHIPVLIHNPEELVGLLDGADKLQGG